MKNFIREKFDLIKVIITAVLLAAATIIFKVVEVDGTIQLIVYIVLYLFIGYETIFGMIKEFKESPFNEDLLMVLATVGALIMGEYFEAVVVMLLFAVGELFEEYAEERTESAVTALSELMPDTASVLIAYARAAYKFSQEKNFGCKTVFDVPPAYLSNLDGAELRAHLL